MTTARLHDDMETAAHTAATVLCPGFRAHRVDRTETSLLLYGVLNSRDVIAKCPIDRRPFWLARARHEITVYQALPALGHVPVTTPRLVAADPSQHLLIITRLPGHAVHPHRYVTGPIPARHLDAVLDLLDHVHRWRPPQPEALPHDDDYRHQLTSVRGSAITDAQFHRALALHTAVADRLQLELQHGDPHLANVIRTDDGQLALIDLEFTAWRLPGHDLAVLWLLLGGAPGTRHQLQHRINDTTDHHAAFWCSALLVCLREIASHQRAPTRPEHRPRLSRLHRDLTNIHDQIRTHHEHMC